MQKVPNPVPRIQHPDWLLKRTREADDKSRQYRITDIFKPIPKALVENQSDNDLSDMEDIAQAGQAASDLDMEDFGTVREQVRAAKRKAAMKNKTMAEKAGVLDEKTLEENELIKNQPALTQDYDGWLQVQKIIWKRQKIDRNRARATGTRRVRSFQSGAENYFLREKETLLNSDWDIIQIVETDIAGEFIIWAMVGQSMHSFRLIVPRILYINLTKEDESIDMKQNLPGMHVEKCSSVLPRSHPSMHLYRMTMLERTYQKNLALLGSKFNSQDVEGVYETQVPLLFRALVKLGVRVQLKKDSGARLEDGFHLDHLKHVPMTPSDPRYLSGANLNYVVMFHAKSGGRHIYAVFSSSSPKATIAFVDPGRNSDQIPRNLSRIYAERFQRVETDDSTVFEYPEEMEFATHVYGTDIEARARINRTLQALKDRRNGPTILVVGSSVIVSNLMDGIPSIKDFPCKMIPYPQTMSMFGSIGWQLTISRKIIGLFLTVEPWIRTEIEMSAYADVPLCNTEADWSVAMIDLFLAREMTKKDMVLWYSVSERPDLGGRQEDNTQPSNVLEESDHEINNPGSYGNITLDLEIGNLAFNTIIQAAIVNELEGSSSIVGFEGGLLNADSSNNLANGKDDMLMTSANYNQLNSNTFAIIRTMIKSWYSKLIVPQNDQTASSTNFEAVMLDSFYRWLTNPNTKMHEPALLGLIHGLMRKVFFQLVAQFRKLGSEACHFICLMLASRLFLPILSG